MKVSRAEVEENRVRILTEAARLFRAHGFAGVSVADIMKTAGLTHGAFYGYFASKEELAAKACEHALEATLAVIGDRAGSGSSLTSFVRGYLSNPHRDALADGCPLAALAGEVARSDAPELKRVFADGVNGYLELIASLEPDGDSKSRRRRALAQLSALVGALLLARAVDDEHLADEILSATRRELLA